MTGIFLDGGVFPSAFFEPTVEFILREQQADGSIHWFEGGHADPWDHVESAMALSIGGQYDAAEKAYRWLKRKQLPCGGWWSAYHGGEVQKKIRRESNFIAYIATGIWHHYLITQDLSFLKEMWPTVEKAIELVVSLQTPHGDIHWAMDKNGQPMQDALVTGCSSIYKSLECAINIAITLSEEKSHWLDARLLLGDALANKPERFDRTWESKARFSMDWFYPVLTGAIEGQAALDRLNNRWDEFVEKGLGCRCVSDEPWVTVAESCELTLALLAAGDRDRALELYGWLHQWKAEDGSYWTGYQMVEDLLWPDEKPTWTAAAILLAADALTDYTPASQLFTQINLLEAVGEWEQQPKTALR